MLLCLYQNNLPAPGPLISSGGTSTATYRYFAYTYEEILEECRVEEARRKAKHCEEVKRAVLTAMAESPPSVSKSEQIARALKELREIVVRITRADKALLKREVEVLRKMREVDDADAIYLLM